MPGTKNPNNPSRFKKGQSGNPAGSSKRYRELKGLARLTHGDMVKLGSELLGGKLVELHAAESDPEASANKVWLAGLILQGIEKRDYKCWESVVNRICGKPREYSQIEHTGADGGPIRTEQELTDAQIVQELAVLRRRNEKG